MAASATDVLFSSSSILSSTSDRSRRSASQHYSSAKAKQQPNSVSRNQVFTDNPAVDSYLVSSTSSHTNPSSLVITRQDVPKTLSSPKKRYVSSFKTLISSTNDKNAQRLNYINDSVMILKLSKDSKRQRDDADDSTVLFKEHAFDVSPESSTGVPASQLSAKSSSVTLTTASINPTSTLMKQPSASSSSNGLSPILKVEGQRRRLASTHDASLTTTSQIDLGSAANSSPNVIMSTTSHSMVNPSLSAYRNTIPSGGSNNRQRTATESSSNGLLFTTERVKSNVSLSVRPLRPSLTAAATPLPSAYISSQQTQRHTHHHQIKSRLQNDRLALNRDMYEYSDPFTNCPQEILTRLSQLTKLQLETIDWEKKRRFTKKKPLANSIIPQGKDSP